MTKSDGIHIIWQIWKQYEETGDAHRLADIIAQLDFSDDWNDNKHIKDGVVSAVREFAGKKDTDSIAIRNRDIVLLHKHYLEQGLSITQSHKKIQEKLEEIGQAMSVDGVRKILERSTDKTN